MDAGSRLIRGGKPFVFTNCLTGDGIADVVDLIMRNLLFDAAPAPELTP
jgi:urease accessory protein